MPHPLCDLTLQAVEDGEDVQQRDPGIAPGEESGAPGESKQQSETCDASQLLHHTTVLAHTRLPHLQQNHEEHGTVHQQNHTQHSHHTHVEHHVV